jgi:hypothetical protein
LLAVHFLLLVLVFWGAVSIILLSAMISTPALISSHFNGSAVTTACEGTQGCGGERDPWWISPCLTEVPTSFCKRRSLVASLGLNLCSAQRGMSCLSDRVSEQSRSGSLVASFGLNLLCPA